MISFWGALYSSRRRTSTPPASGGQITTFTLEGTSAPDGTIVPFAQGFKMGDLLPSDTMTALRVDTSTYLRTQFNPITTWGDGSVKVALIAIEVPLVATSALLSCAYVKGVTHASVGTTIVMSAALSARSASIIHSTSLGTHTFDVIANLTTANWWSGPLYASQRLQVTPLPTSTMGVDSARLTVDIGISKDGRVDLDANTCNDIVMQVSGGRTSYRRVMLIDSVSLHVFTTFEHTMYGWMNRSATRTSSGVSVELPHIIHNYSYLVSSGLAPAYDTLLSFSEADYAAAVTNPLAAGDLSLPYDNWNLARAAGTAGGRTEIGLVTYPCLRWLQNGNKTAKYLAKIHSQIEPLKDYNHFDLEGNTFVNVVNWPKFCGATFDQNESPPGTPRVSALGFVSTQRPTNDATNHMTVDDGHQGSYHYIPALLGGRRTDFDSLASRASQQSHNNFDRHGADPTISWRNYTPDFETGYAWGPSVKVSIFQESGQVRGFATKIRDTGRAAAILPDNYPERQFFNNNVRAFVNTFATQVSAWDARSGDLAGFIRTAGGAEAGVTEHSPHWMNAMYKWSLLEALRHVSCSANGVALINHVAKFSPAAMLNSAFNWRTGAVGYDILIGDCDASTTRFYKTWASAQAAQVAKVPAWDVSTNWVMTSLTMTGEHQRMVMAALVLTVDSSLVSEEVRMNSNEALIRIRNERVTGPIDFPRTDPDIRFAANQAYAFAPPGITYSYAVQPVVQSSQTFSVAYDASVSTRLGLIRTKGAIPRGPANDSTGAYVIVSQPSGNPFALTQGGVLIKVAPASLGDHRIALYATVWNGTSAVTSELRGPTVDVSVNVFATSVVLAQPANWVVNSNAAIGTTVGILSATGSRDYTFIEVSGDTNNLFTVNSSTGVVLVAATVAPFVLTSFFPTYRATNVLNSNEKIGNIGIIVPISAPDIVAGQAFTVEEGLPIGTSLTPASVSYTGGLASNAVLVSGNTSSRFSINVPAILRTNAVLSRADATKYHIEVQLENSGGIGNRTVSVSVQKSAYVGGGVIANSDVLFAGSPARRLRDTYTGPLIRVRRSSDGAEQDIGFTGASAVLDVSAVTSFVGANQGFVAVLYDQSPIAQHVSMSVSSRQPEITNVSGTIHRLDGTQTRPAILYDNAAGFENNGFSTRSSPSFGAFVLARKLSSKNGSGGDRIISLAATTSADDNTGQTSFRFAALLPNSLRVGRNGTTDFSTTTFPVSTGRWIGGVTGTNTSWNRNILVNSGVSPVVSATYTSMAAVAALHIGYHNVSVSASLQSFHGTMADIFIFSSIDTVTDVSTARVEMMAFAGF